MSALGVLRRIRDHNGIEVAIIVTSVYTTHSHIYVSISRVSLLYMIVHTRLGAYFPSQY